MSAPVLEIIATVAAGLTLTALGTLGLRLRKSAKALGLFLRDWSGEPARPGVLARLGVMERLDRLEHKVGDVHYELHRNGGGSTKDDVVATKESVQRIENIVSGSQPPPVTVNVGGTS